MSTVLGQKKIAVMVILRHGDSFLLLLRSREPNRGMYAPVGGKLEPHETPRQAALRETFEETGLRLAALRCCGVLSETSPVAYNWLCYIYVAEIERLPPPPCDEGTLEWIDFQDILRVPTPPTDWQIYRYVLAGKSFAFDAIFDENLRMTRFEEELEGIVFDPADGFQTPIRG